jgi:type I restriction enzyme M protein
VFYTVTPPCTLWFFDKGKAKTPRADPVLFIDARHIYRQIDRAHREWTPAQIGYVANLVRLYRGQALDFALGGGEARAKVQEVFGGASNWIRSRGPRKCARDFSVSTRGQRTRASSGRSETIIFE